MISPSEIKAKAEKKYFGYLQSIVADMPFSAIVIRGSKKTSNDLATFQKELRSLQSQSKEQKGYGYTITYQRVHKKDIGTQDVPREISFQSESDFLKYLHKEKEVAYFRENIKRILSAFIELKKWIYEHPIKVISYQKNWIDLLKVCHYFQAHPTPNLYLRELPIAVHTKFIEQHKTIIKELLDLLIVAHINTNETRFEKRFHLKYAEPTVRFRMLDAQIAKTYFSDIDDLSISISKFSALRLPVKKVFIVENKLNVLSLPMTRETIVIFGSGYGVENLQYASWLKEVALYYWGDLDAQGFEILSQCRTYFPHTKSFLMDQNTFDIFYENDQGTISNVREKVNLTDAENALYQFLKENNKRLEQEKIPQSYVNQQMGNLC